MNDTYTLPNTDAGRVLRDGVVRSLTSNGITYREYEETVAVGQLTFVLLKLEVTGKRPGEGRIAETMKERKS